MFVVGLTGGIGSGKSALSHHFEALGILVIDADQVAREVVEPGEPALDSIVSRFGAESLLENGSLDRRHLRDVVFTEPKQRNWLEQLLHPIIRDRIMQKLEQSDSRYTILTSPLLLETDQHLLVNHVIVVDAPEALQIERTMARDSSTADQVRSIISAQMERTERLGKADDVVDNSGTENDLQPQALTLHEKFLKQAQQDWEAEH